MKKKQFAGSLCSKLRGLQSCIQSTVLCEVFFTQLGQKTRMSSSAGCYITQLDSSHSLIHFSAYLYPFKGHHNPPPSQAGTQTRLMNNRKKDVARLLRENKWSCMSCVENLSEWDLDQSSTYCWHKWLFCLKDDNRCEPHLTLWSHKLCKPLT